MQVNPVQTATNMSTTKKTAAGIGTAAAAAGGLVYLARTGRLNANEGGNLIKESAKTALRIPAKFFDKQVKNVQTGVSKFLEKHPKLSEKVNGAVDFVSNKYKSAKKAVGDAINTVTSKFSKKSASDSTSVVA